MTTTPQQQSPKNTSRIGYALMGPKAAELRVPPSCIDTPAAPFRRSLLLAAIWWIALVVLVLLTANPVTLNIVQLQMADAIVTARLVDPLTGELDVEKEWTGRHAIGAMQLDPLVFADAAADSKWLIPLSRTGRERYEITRAIIRSAGGEADVQPPYVYKWNDDSRAQLEAFLARR